MSKVIIVGSTGFVGHAISKHLCDSNIKTFEINRHMFNQILNSKESIHEIVDYQDSIVFAAAKAPVKNYADFSDNLDLTKKFVSIFQNVRFAYLLNISSDAVYPDLAVPLKEIDALAPTSLHGCMHYTRETILDLSFPGKVGHLRPTSIYGIGDTHQSYGPNLFLQSLNNFSKIKIFGKGEELRDHIHIDDVALLSIKMIQLSLAEALNAATGCVVSFREIAEIFQLLAPLTTIEYVSRTSEILPHGGYRAFDISKVKKLLPSFAPINISTGLASILNIEY